MNWNRESDSFIASFMLLKAVFQSNERLGEDGFKMSQSQGHKIKTQTLLASP